MRRSLLASVLLALLLPAVGAADAATAGRVASLSGALLAAKADGRIAALALDSAVDAGDTLHTDSAAWAMIRFNDGSAVTIKPDSQFRVQEFEFRQNDASADKAILVLIKGGLRALTGLIGKRNRNDAYNMRTPTATIGIRGTDYGLQYCAAGECAGKTSTSGEPLADGLHLEVFEGRIAVVNEAGSIELGARQFGYVKDRGTPPATAADGYHDAGMGTGAGECVAR